MRPARDAAQVAALRASAVFQSVLRGPKPPAPAGWGVEPEKFRGTLRWFRWRELAAFANHFGKHGSVVNDLAIDLANEVGRRLGSTNVDSLSGSGGSSSSGSAADKDQGSSVVSPSSSKEIASVTYSFSKLTPQLPEYKTVFAAVAQGINFGLWRFSILEAGLIGTALVDVEVHLSDALPAIVRPAIKGLSRRDNEAVTIDELRFLVHSCTCLPSPGIKIEEVEILAACTQRLVGEANFAKAAHLAVSWLQIQSPAKAKKHYLDALGAVCTRVCEERPTHPAHPLLMSRLSPSLGSLIAREGHRDPPPLTPPLVRDIIGALAKITQGILSDSTRPAKGEALGFSDWVEIVRLVIDFCEDHGPEVKFDASKTLPGWAAEALGFTVRRANNPFAESGAPDPQSLLTVLRLLRQYKAKPVPTDHFYAWVVEQLQVEHHPAHDSVLFAEIVGELVPQLHPNQRARFARTLFSKAQDVSTATGQAIAHDVANTVPEMRTSVRQLLNDVGSKPRANFVSIAMAKDRPTTVTKPKSVRARVLDDTVSASAVVAPGQFRLWDRLSSLSVSRQASLCQPMVHEAPRRPADVVGNDMLSETGVCTNPRPVRNEIDDVADVSRQQVEHLQALLQQALKRVEALEAKLEEQSSGFRSDLEDLRGRARATEVKVEGMPRHQVPPTESIAMPQFMEWSSTFLSSADSVEGGARRVGNSGGSGNIPANIPGKAPLHLRRPFSFEEIRRSQTQELQNERLRVLVPPDPMWPLPKKF